MLIKTFLVEDGRKIELFAQLDADVLVDRVQAQAHQDLFVEMRLQVRKLRFLDNAALQNDLFIIQIHPVKQVEQRQEFGIDIYPEAPHIQLELPLF